MAYRSLALLLVAASTRAFTVIGSRQRQAAFLLKSSNTTTIGTTVAASSSSFTQVLQYDKHDRNDPMFANAEYYQVDIFPHKPLGCTVEESLASGVKAHVFVTRTSPDGNAEKFGIKAGDVIVGLSDLFGTLIDVQGYTLDRIKGLVSSRPEDEHLQLVVARNTKVVEAHEEALVAICSDPSMDVDGSEACIVDYIKNGYNYAAEDDNVAAVVAMTRQNPTDAELECVIDSQTDAESESAIDCLYQLWADDENKVGIKSGTSNSDDDSSSKTESTPVSSEKTVKPWSSRSSPSGTWVRDPATGKLRNIDS